jgi:hypothetical protein
MYTRCPSSARKSSGSIKLIIYLHLVLRVCRTLPTLHQFPIYHWMVFKHRDSFTFTAEILMWLLHSMENKMTSYDTQSYLYFSTSLYLLLIVQLSSPPFMGLHIIPNILFSDILNLCFLLRVRDQVLSTYVDNIIKFLYILIHSCLNKTWKNKRF